MSLKKEKPPKQKERIFERMKAGEENALDDLYSNYRSSFISWAGRKYRLGEEDAADIFQDVAIIFYKNVLSGKLMALESSLKTYLFGIGKNLIYKKIEREQRRIQTVELPDYGLEYLDYRITHSIEQEEQRQQILQLFEALGEACQKILTLFFYKRFTMEAIQHAMGYNSNEVARSMKHKCMNRLKEMAAERLKGG